MATFISFEYNTKPWHAIQKAPQDTNLLRSELCSNFDLFIYVSDNYVVPGGKPLSEITLVTTMLSQVAKPLSEITLVVTTMLSQVAKPLSEIQSIPEHCSLQSSLFNIYFLDLSIDDLIADFSAPYFGNPNNNSSSS